MKPILACATVALLVAGCGDRGDRPVVEAPQVDLSPSADTTIAYCGGDTTDSVIRDYFRRLAEHLETETGPVPLAFYSETFTMVSGGRAVVFNREEMGAGARVLPSREDWREISRRGEQDLKSGGWRGCFQGDGNPVFEASAEGTLGLKAFDKDRPWPERR